MSFSESRSRGGIATSNSTRVHTNNYLCNHMLYNNVASTNKIVEVSSQKQDKTGGKNCRG